MAAANISGAAWPLASKMVIRGLSRPEVGPMLMGLETYLMAAIQREAGSNNKIYTGAGWVLLLMPLLHSVPLRKQRCSLITFDSICL